MFERYTEKARRTIFFARFEASQYGSTTIETEHLLLGILREAKTEVDRYLGPEFRLESIREQIDARTVAGEKVPTHVDLPLSNECKRILAYAAEEAMRAGNSLSIIGPEHLLLGILREKGCFAEHLLTGQGVDLNKVREAVAKAVGEKAGTSEPSVEEPPLPKALLDCITQKATSAVIFAMYEASRAGSPTVETEHLLLGLVHEDGVAVNRLIGVDTSEDSLRQEIQMNAPVEKRKRMTLANMPLSHEGKRVIMLAGEEAVRMGLKVIGTGHLLMGLLREEKCFAAQMLVERGAHLEAIRKRLLEDLAAG